jgi:hypothetical protein
MSTAQAIPFSFDEAGHVYRDERGTVIPSVTQVLNELGFSNYAIVEQMNPVALERKRQIGKLVHQACHFWDIGDLNEELQTKPWPVIQGRLDAYKLFRKNTGYTPIVNEGRMMGGFMGMLFGMQYDSIGTIGKRWVVCDIKNASGSGQRSWGIQEAAYEAGIKAAITSGRFPFPLTPEQVRGILSAPMLRVIPQLFDDGTYKLHTSDDAKSKVFFENDSRVWQSALCISLDKRNH